MSKASEWEDSYLEHAQELEGFKYQCEGWMQTYDGQEAYAWFWKEYLEPQGVGQEYDSWLKLDEDRFQLFYDWVTNSEHWEKYIDYVVHTMPSYDDAKAAHDEDMQAD